ncbi:similar to Saccharomyces cerevisiae YLR377C FBP1 Fructose-1,6-bisphosphatase, key regulatory enzyme in the gluconeogenesis pathway, required for glucose metabolism [Maudiozyma barnettii]|uniref:Fructose-1,6-bisphosphatase n=1 Tax=Maudiozyma barnettii TaxID=61262 RepID=A0A8H2ZJP9_9SACH|nr:fructose 1,6-bisphosphate 1-phosphatase [Kazachstania barnettii]CAB4257273.1 similar to Saccharomyces cerevisiae YLR377C FBP1 Fructose-1,6-bisphosphatase, key regulatory enzyme in the gluconeogenesis pathway, required for glucose metabolism [Kazachstania barnettii]CAD1784538.1 similar to Saccharomyces cerevisiae YLR377C FBP1 Fructose-1,6-bisphosphatase, key regulatory enzyme in the gluconeogenesis pathway, required for glucose metabolism [Kazachstania barnettii]
MPAISHRRDSLEDINTDLVTLPRFIIETQQSIKGAKGDFTLVLNALGFAFKFISQTIRKAELINLVGITGNTNSTGDQQKKLDVLGDEIFINAMSASGIVKLVISEEQEDMIIFHHNDSKYAICCDPIDGSSNLDAGVSVGTICSIFRILPGSTGSTADVLRHGAEMVGACYAMYGASTHLMLTLGNGVSGFTLDNTLGEFILVHPELRIPSQRSIYSINEGNSYYWDKHIVEFIDSLKKPQDHDGKPYSARYIGSMVADLHRTFLYGGLFSYPADKKNPNGKLRLLYEAFPMAMLVEQAGGKAVNDQGQRILDLCPTHIHDKSSVWMGSNDDVDKYLKHIGKL